jgi:hypothetical protein
MNKFEKEKVIAWLNTEVDNNMIIYDYVLDIRDDILNELYNNNLSLKYDKEIFTINLIDYLYKNSFTSINDLRPF